MAQQPLHPDFIPDNSPDNTDADFHPDFIPDDTSVDTSVDNKPGFLSKTWKAISEPLTTIPSQFADSIADYIDQPDPNSDGGYLSGLKARSKGFLAGATQGVGNVLSSMTSPIDLAAMLMSGGESLAAKSGMKATAKALNVGTKIAGGAVTAHGGAKVLDPESTLTDRATGFMEAAGGMAGMLHGPHESFDLSPAEKVNDIVPNEPVISKPKPRLRLERDGSYTNLDTGETHIPDRPLTKTKSAIENGNTPALGPVNMPDDLIIKEPTLTNVSQAVKDGYKYTGTNEDGSYQFQKLPDNPNEHLGKLTDVKKDSALQEAFNFPRAVMASMDFSAPLRQGLPLIYKKQFWTSLDDMFKSFGSEEAFRQVQKSITEDPSGLFKKRSDGSSVAEDAGLALMDLTDINKREEAIMSTWAEKIPGIRPSNRAYTAFLNKLRADTFKSLVKNADVMTGEINTNIPLTKELANFVNVATGRGSLGSLESSAKVLNSTLFAPRLIASRLQLPYAIISPNSSPTVRKEALKAMLTVIGVGNTVVELAKMGGAHVENDPASSDFRKAKIGNVRIDPFAGFQQYAVLADRLVEGRMKSSTTDKEYSLSDNKFGHSNRFDVLQRFGESKLNPVATFAIGLLKGKDPITGQPFNIPNEVAERMVPIIVQDIVQLASEEPDLLPGVEKIAKGKGKVDKLPFAIPSAFGMGIQNYDKVRR